MTRLENFGKWELKSLLRRGHLVLDLGLFSARIRSGLRETEAHLRTLYAKVPARADKYALTHQVIDVNSPYWLRKYFRPQVIARTLNEMPMVPLPVSAAGLAFEMGLNFSVATAHYGHVIVHAGVVADCKGGIIMSAASGKGKSTLTAALMQNGARLLSDEFGLIATDDACLAAYPRPISLKNESIEVVRSLLGSKSVSVPIKNTPKGSVAYAVPRKSDIDAATEKTPPSLILFPTYSPHEKPMASLIDKPQALMRLIAASPNYQIIGSEGFQALARVVEMAPAYEITYGSSEQALNLIQSLPRGPMEQAA